MASSDWRRECAVCRADCWARRGERAEVLEWRRERVWETRVLLRAWRRASLWGFGGTGGTGRVG